MVWRRAQVEGRPPALYCLADGFNVGIGVLVQELQEESEIVRVALVRSRRQQQHVVRAVAEQFAEPVAHTLVAFVPRRHTVRFVNDYEVPMDLAQPRQNILPFGKV